MSSQRVLRKSSLCLTPSTFCHYVVMCRRRPIVSTRNIFNSSVVVIRRQFKSLIGWNKERNEMKQLYLGVLSVCTLFSAELFLLMYRQAVHFEIDCHHTAVFFFFTLAFDSSGISMVFNQHISGIRCE